MQLPHLLNPWIVAATGLLIASCGGNGSSDNSNSGGDDPDAVVVDIPIAYVKRQLPFDEDGVFIEHDALDPSQFVPGAELFIRERADVDAQETSITEGVFAEGELYDVKDLVASNDGSNLLFAMRAPEIEDADDDEQPTWNIWQYDLDSDTLSRIITDDITAEQGQDVSPAYLPDGRIVFSSNRQVRSKAILLDEGKPQYAAQTDSRDEDGYVLHVMDEFGTNIDQITFNQSHDLQPIILSNGKIAFNRWNNKNNVNRLSLYTTRPDGQLTQDLYGFNSQNTGFNDGQAMFYRPKPMVDGRLLAMLRPRQSANWGGDLVAIDIDQYSDINQDINQAISDDPGGDTSTPGQESLAFGEIIIDNDPSTISLNGYFAAAADLFDDSSRLLVAWTDCRLQHPTDGTVLACIDSNLAIDGITEANPLYGLWVYNLGNNTLQPVLAGEAGFMYTDIITFAPRAEDTFIADQTADALADDGLAILHIRNVYEVDGVDTAGIATLADPLLTTADERPARFVKIEKPVSMPDNDVVDFDNAAFGFSNVMREIIGYVPVEPDGSVKTLIPADVALTISLTNALGQRVSGNTSIWFNGRPGEVIESNDLNVAINRLDETNASSNPGAPNNGYNFPNTNPLLIAMAGETMAETWTRIRFEAELDDINSNNTYTYPARKPSVDLVFDDVWTDPNVRTPDASFRYRYLDLPTLATDASYPDGFTLTPTSPVGADCTDQADDIPWINQSWNGACRIVLHYPDHIQPIWELLRQTFDAGDNLISDNTCTLCHNDEDAMGQTQVPDGQLELTQALLDNNNQFRSFRELGANDILFELDENGDLVPVMVPVLDGNGDPVPVVDADGNIVFQLDENGDPILDENGDPVPEWQMTTVNVARSLVPNNAAGSDFFTRFAAGGSHEGYLSNAEIKLISEWLDLGGQYYNNPFDAPAD